MNDVAGPAVPEIDYDARFKELESHPLFMRDIPDDIEANERLEALQSLIYDDTPDSMYTFPFHVFPVRTISFKVRD